MNLHSKKLLLTIPSISIDDCILPGKICFFLFTTRSQNRIGAEFPQPRRLLPDTAHILYGNPHGTASIFFAMTQRPKIRQTPTKTDTNYVSESANCQSFHFVRRHGEAAYMNLPILGRLF